VRLGALEFLFGHGSLQVSPAVLVTERGGQAYFA
jgi:hypothetical protein